MAKKLKDALEEKYGKGKTLVFENGVYLRSGTDRAEREMQRAARDNRYRD